MAHYRLNTVMAHCKYYRQKWVKREFHAVWNACLPKEYYLWHWLAEAAWVPGTVSIKWTPETNNICGLVHLLTVQSPKSWLEVYARVHVLNCLPRDQHMYNAGVNHFVFERKRPVYACVTKWVVTSTAKPECAQPLSGSTWLCCRPFWPAAKKWWPLKG